MQRYKITIEYLGTNFKGWQKQKKCKTIQETFEKATKKLVKEDVNSYVAGRTDSGVHAFGQVVHLDIRKKIENSKFKMGLNYYLSREKFGSDISVKEVKKVTKTFNARFSAIKKHYQYKIFNSDHRSPILDSSSWWVKKKLDLSSMKLGAMQFLGNHNFNSFRAKGCQAGSPIKTINKVTISKGRDLITINFFARSFLYNQVRIMVGTLQDVGLGRIKHEEIKKIIDKKNRSYAGITAPAKGLTLVKVFY